MLTIRTILLLAIKVPEIHCISVNMYIATVHAGPELYVIVKLTKI